MDAFKIHLGLDHRGLALIVQAQCNLHNANYIVPDLLISPFILFLEICHYFSSCVVLNRFTFLDNETQSIYISFENFNIVSSCTSM